MGIGMGQLILVFLLVLLFFGAKRLPEIARAMGKAASEFQKAKNEALGSPVQTAGAENADESKPASAADEKKDDGAKSA